MNAVECVRTPEERFAELPGFPFAPRFATLPGGLRMHYVDEGPAGAEAVLLLHGQPTWSYLYRTVDRPAWSRTGCARWLLTSSGSGARTNRWRARRIRSRPTSTGWPSSSMRVGPARLHPGRPGLGRAHRTRRAGGRPGLVHRVVAANTALHTADPGLAGRLAWACHAGPDGTVTGRSRRCWTTNVSPRS